MEGQRTLVIVRDLNFCFFPWLQAEGVDVFPISEFWRLQPKNFIWRIVYKLCRSQRSVRRMYGVFLRPFIRNYCKIIIFNTFDDAFVPVSEEIKDYYKFENWVERFV